MLPSSLLNPTISCQRSATSREVFAEPTASRLFFLRTQRREILLHGLFERRRNFFRCQFLFHLPAVRRRGVLLGNLAFAGLRFTSPCHAAAGARVERAGYSRRCSGGRDRRLRRLAFHAGLVSRKLAFAAAFVTLGGAILRRAAGNPRLCGRVAAFLSSREHRKKLLHVGAGALIQLVCRLLLEAVEQFSQLARPHVFHGASRALQSFAEPRQRLKPVEKLLFLHRRSRTQLGLRRLQLGPQRRQLFPCISSEIELARRRHGHVEALFDGGNALAELFIACFLAEPFLRQRLQRAGELERLCELLGLGLLLKILRKLFELFGRRSRIRRRTRTAADAQPDKREPKRNERRSRERGPRPFAFEQ